MAEKLTALLSPLRLSFNRKSCSNPTLLFEAGVYYLENAKYVEAKSRFDRYLQEIEYGKEGITFSKDQIDSFIVPTLCHLATCYLELHQYAKTIQYCQEVLQKRPDHKRALFLQNIASIEMGTYEGLHSPPPPSQQSSRMIRRATDEGKWVGFDI